MTPVLAQWRRARGRVLRAAAIAAVVVTSVVVRSEVVTSAVVAAFAPVLAADTDTGRTRLFKYIMGTSVRVEVYGGTPATRQQAADEVFASMAEVDRVMSDYRDDSELTRVNREATTQAVPVSPPLFAVLDAADRVARESGGAFDMTVRPLAVLWGLKSATPHVPTATALAAVRPLVGFRGLQLDARAHTVRLTQRGMGIDLGGVAKGFAAELAAGALTRRGLSGVVDAGGHQHLVGAPLGKSAWTVGIADPDNPGRLLGAVDVQRGGVSTTAHEPSRAPGVLANQVLDPRTLQPSPVCISATVVSPDGTLAQALSQAACVLGADAGLALLERFPDTWGIIAVRRADGATGLRVSPNYIGRFHPAAAS